VKIFMSALVIGVFLGTIYGIMALGMVASYRINRVVNLGQAGLAAGGATVYWWMTSVWGAPVLVSLVGGVLFGMAIGAGLGMANIRMVAWPRGFVMIFTLTITLLIFAWTDTVLPPQQVSPMSPFGTSGFNFGLTYIQTHQIGTLLTCIGVALLCTWVVKKTRTGMYVRAIYDDPDGASTLGIPIGLFVIGVWAAAGGMAALAGILVSPRTTLDTLLLLFVTVWALAGAILGGLESFGIALAGGLVLGVSQGVLGGVFGGSLGPGFENLAAIALMGVGVIYAGIRNRDVAHIQT
jgi:branched-chain amino acid transport system permease protein